MARSISHTLIPKVVVLVNDGLDLDNVFVFNPKHKRDDDKPIDGDIDKMNIYRDAIRDRQGRRVVTYAGIVYSGEGRDYSGEVGPLPGIQGPATSVESARERMRAAMDVVAKKPSSA